VSSPEPTAAERKLTARRTNEHLKLAASFLNALALAIIGAAFVVPGVTSLELVRWICSGRTALTSDGALYVAAPQERRLR
jgi:predicted anti-sigma-YlaC factor YlaD